MRNSQTTFRIAGLILVFGWIGCEQKRSEAVVLEKEHIAVREITGPSPTTATGEAMKAGENDKSESAEEPTELPADEIAVDGYIMKKRARGTASDPRARSHEQWRVKVRTTDTGRVFNVQIEQDEYEKLHAGDRVKVTYRVGKYTNTVWDAELKGR